MSKRVFVVGEGAREHTLCWAISNSPQVSKVYCAPGNGGTSGSATNVPIGVTDISGLTDFAAGESFDLVVVGPEIPLSLGLADSLRSRGLLTYGPSTSGRKNRELETVRQAGHARCRRADGGRPQLR